MKSHVVYWLVWVALLSGVTQAFVSVQPPQDGMMMIPQRTSATTRRYNSPQDDQDREERLRTLGYSDDEIQKSTATPSSPPANVRVDVVEDIDPVTITALGFGAIAFNFLILGNLGDGGIGGVVATIINLMNQ